MPNRINLLLVHPQQEMCDAFEERFSELPRVKVIHGRFEDLPPHDCFVTAANAFGIMTAGIDAAVVQRFGELLMQHVQLRVMDEYLGEQPVGTAFILPTGDEVIPFVCHAPTMRVPGCIAGTSNVYQATWAALLAVYRHNTQHTEKIETVGFPAFGAGFGEVPFEEVARQMSVAYRHFVDPPHRLNWETVARRQKAICYDKGKQVINR